MSGAIWKESAFKIVILDLLSRKEFPFFSIKDVAGRTGEGYNRVASSITILKNLEIVEILSKRYEHLYLIHYTDLNEYAAKHHFQDRPKPHKKRRKS